MSEIIKNGAGLFGRIVIVNVMCFFVFISMSVLCTAAFTENIGYIAYGTLEGEEEAEELYTYYNADGDDTQQAEYEEAGYTVTTQNIRSEMTNTGTNIFLWVSQIFALLILTAFIYPQLWQLGAKDSNLVRFKHKSEDVWKGLKIGLTAICPAVLLWAVMLILKAGVSPQFPVIIYKFLNSSLYSIIEVILGGAAYVSQLSVLRLILLLAVLFIVPIVGTGAYWLGYKDISLGEHFVYKKNKT